MTKQPLTDAYLSGWCAGSNAASLNGPTDKPVPGRSARSKTYALGWDIGFKETRARMKSSRSAYPGFSWDED